MTLPAPIEGFRRRRIEDERPAAVYLLYEDDSERVAYVGVGYDPFLRIKYHRKNAPWGTRITSWSARWYETHDEAKIVETATINALQPRYNIAGTPLHREVSLGIRPPTHRGVVPVDAAPMAAGHYR